MDRELLDDKRIYERNDSFKPADDKDIQQEQKEEKEEKENPIKILTQTLRHYYPQFNEWLEELSDRRKQGAISYSRAAIVWTALIGILTKQGSRKRISDYMRGDISSSNLRRLSGQEGLEKVPHADTVEYFCLGTEEKDFEGLQVRMVRELLRKRVLEKYRLQNKYHSVSIDGCHVYSFDYRHCKHCLVREDENGKKHWFHYKIQASLVTPSGLCIAMASEWIENEDNYDKQDCELRAFYRIIEKIRILYPRLPICVLLDGLYAVKPVFEHLRKHKMEWIIVFKKGRSSETYNWVMNWKERFGKDKIVKQKREKVIALRKRRSRENKFIRRKRENKSRAIVTETTYTWMSGIEHWDDKRRYNVMTCKEVKDKKTKCDYVWLVSEGLNLNKDNVKELSERGRCRWKIENEGINTQKNGGYGLEHQYSRDPVSMKIWNRIIDMAHLINQLIEQGSLITKAAYKTIKAIAQKMFDHFRYVIFKKPDS